MKKIRIFCFLFLTLASASLFTSCSKLVNGELRFSNNSANPYNCYVDGGFKFKLNGNNSKDIDVKEGEHTVRVEQVSGYLVYPTILNWNVTVQAGKAYSITFP